MTRNRPLLPAAGVLAWLALWGCGANGETPQIKKAPEHLVGPQEPAPEEAAFRPGQAIVRFAESSPAAAAVGEAAKGRLHEEPALADYLERLSEEIGVPVTARQLGAGGEVVLEIDREAVQKALGEHLAEDPRVEATAAVDTSGESPFADPGIELRATLSSAEAARSAGGVDELAAELCRGFELPVEGRAAGEAEVTVRADLRELTRELLRRLAEHPDVESAEPNRMLQTF